MLRSAALSFFGVNKDYSEAIGLLCKMKSKDGTVSTLLFILCFGARMTSLIWCSWVRLKHRTTRHLNLTFVLKLFFLYYSFKHSLIILEAVMTLSLGG